MPEILPNIHSIDSLFDNRRLASFLLAGEKALLIDSGLAYTPEQTILPYLNEIGLAKDRLSWLVVTHASGDHFGGNAAIKKTFPGVSIVAHQLDAPSISNHSMFIAEHIQILANDGVPVPVVKENDPDFIALHGTETMVNHLVQGGETFNLGQDWNVFLLHTPGHTPGHLMVYDPSNRVLFAGDGLMGDGIRDIHGSLVMPPHYFDVDQYRRTIQIARELSPEYILLSHYPILSHSEVFEFLDTSLEFVNNFDKWLVSIIRDLDKEIPIPSLITMARDRLGIPDADYQYGLLIRAHLTKYLLDEKAAHSLLQF